MSLEEFKVPQPPDILFVRSKRTPTTGEETQVYLLDKIDCVEGKGVLVYRIGAEFPEKGWPTPEALYSLNQIKRLLLEFSGMCKNPFILLGVITSNKEKLMVRFNTVFCKIFEVHLLKEEFMCPASRNFFSFIRNCLIDLKFNEDISTRFSFYVSQILEYDNAYRYRAQDMMTSLNIYRFQENPRKEIIRLMDLWQERESSDSKGVAVKMKQLLKPLLLLLLLPKFKKVIVNNLSYLKKMEFDEGDWYWCRMRGEYNYKGISFEDRMQGLIEPKKYYVNT